ncbi:MAG TPA: hypothetical protein VK469_20805, partial [Candidatus Kapabacteria bacterium]|nr:hypothetical protein [Candidatus Kapabacteria bacterium]
DPIRFANSVVLHINMGGFTWKDYNTTSVIKIQPFKKKNGRFSWLPGLGISTPRTPERRGLVFSDVV